MSTTPCSSSSVPFPRTTSRSPSPKRLTLDLNFNPAWSLQVPPSASSYMTAPTSALPSPCEDEDEVFRPSVVQASPRPNTEYSLTFTATPGSDCPGYRDSSGSSSADSDLTVLFQPRHTDPLSYAPAQQRYLCSAAPTPYYTAHSTPEPELFDDGPKAGPSRLPQLDTNISLSLRRPSPPTPTTSPLSRDPVSDRPPSPAPTADFSMISPPSSPTFYQYASQWTNEPDPDPFRSPHIRGTATLPFLRSNSTSVAGSFARSQSMSAGVGLGPLMSKQRRTRPGISRLWESIASPAKTSPQPSSIPHDARLTPIPAVRVKSSPMPGFSVVRSKTSPMMGVGRKLKEKRRIKRVRRGTSEMDTDVDYGALDPLDGEEGELIGCTCSGWGDGACGCGYGCWDTYDYGNGHTQEPECSTEGG